MPVRMTGMISGMDTESLIKDMVSAQRLKNKKYSDKKTKLEWKEEKWKDLNTKLYALYTGELSKLRMQGNYATRKVTSSNESKVEVTGKPDSPIGSHTLEIHQLASSQYVTGGQLGSDVKGSTKLKDLGIDVGTNIKITAGGKEVNLQVKEDTTLNNFLSSCTSVGLNASYDASQKRIFISSKESGLNNKFTITTTTLSTDAIDARKAIEDALNYKNLSSSDKAKVDKAFYVIKNGTAEEKEKTIKELQSIAEKNAKADVLNNAGNFVAATIKKSITSDSALMDAIKDKHTAALTEELKKSITDEVNKDKNNGVPGLETEEQVNAEIERRLAEKKQDYLDEKLQPAIDKEITGRINTELKNTEHQDKIKEYVANGLTDTDILNSGLTTEELDEFKIIASDSESVVVANAKNNIEGKLTAYESVTESDGVATGKLNNLGLGEIDGTKVDAADKSKMTVVSAADSEITYNGAKLTNSSNVVTANGLTFTLKGVTDHPTDATKNETISLNVTNNTEETYKMIKNFVKSYNAILKEMNELYYADSSRGYDPLSDDEREAMTDDQVKKWEDKIKDSILRRDDTVGSITSAMKSSLQIAVEVDGKKYTLSSFGVGTSNDYSEKGLLHITGDEDEKILSGVDNKLMKALEENPDTVMQVFTGVANKLYETMQDKMKKTSLSSALTFYNDKEMTTQKTAYSKKIAELEKKLTVMENRYYKQFAAMESAMAKLQSQQSQLAGMLGTNQ